MLWCIAQGLGFFDQAGGVLRANLGWTPFSSQLEIRAGGREIVLRGGLGLDLRRRVQAALADGNVRRLRLDSSTGHPQAALQLLQIVQQEQLNSYVDRRCAGPCLAVFLAGSHRTVERRALIGFAPLAELPVSVDWLTSQGIAPWFIAGWQRQPRGMGYLPVEELRRAGVITTLSGQPAARQR